MPLEFWRNLDAKKNVYDLDYQGYLFNKVLTLDSKCLKAFVKLAYYNAELNYGDFFS